MIQKLPATVFYQPLSDELNFEGTVTMQVAEQLFNYCKYEPVFRWSDANNDCEDRANAICILLDEWGVPNFKGWLFSGYYLKKNYGSLVNYWNYHVAALIPVTQQEEVSYWIIDPATSNQLVTIEEWSLQMTLTEISYHFIKQGMYYIFPPKKIEKHNWYKRNKRNYRWTIQGLSGINGVSTKGKAQLSFKKNMVKKTEERFRRLKNNPPAFLDVLHKQVNK
ncbi:MAG: hypothetical protein JWQ96_453 [Segetibacter sp.]|nr:hypothetical protein [Segetibacter sp.]